MSAGRSRRFGPEHTKPAASATVAGHSGGICFFCAVCIFVPVFPLILGCKLSFLPVTKKGTFFLPQKSICFPPLKILFFVGNKKRYVKMRRKSRRKIKGKRRKTLYLNNVQYFSPLEHDRRVIVFLCIFCF